MKQRYSKSSGYVLVLFALVLGVLVSIAGVAVDIGNLYIIRNRLERAAKAGALAGVGYRSLRGWDYFATYAAGAPTLKSTKDELFGVISGVVRANMQAAFSAPSDASAAEVAEPSTVTGNLGNLTVLPTFTPLPPNNNTNFYNASNDTFTARVTYNAPTFIIGRLSAALGAATCPLDIRDGKYRCPITVTETAQLEKAVVALLLDTSGSMNCPANNALGCTCRTSTTPCSSTGRVIDALVTALAGFRSFFNPYRDYITVIPFNLAAFNSFSIVLGTAASGPPISFGNTQARYDDFMNNKTSLAGLIPKSNTNICDAFIEAIAELKRINNLADFHPFVIAFTDGAPNAFRGEFLGGVDTAGAVGNLTRDNNPATSTGLTNDWYQYGLEWSTATTPLTTYRGPGPLVNRQLVGGKPRLFDHIISSTTGIWPTSPTLPSNVCGQAYSESAQHPAILNFNATPVVPIKGCLSNLNFKIPGTGGTASVNGVQIDPDGSAATKFNYAKLPYYCAIEAADYIRSNLAAPATVYTIGVGNPGSANCQDPFENVDNPLIRKDNFLARVALDPETLTESAGNFTVTPNSKFDFQSTRSNVQICNLATSPGQAVGYTPGSNTKKTTPDVQGEYFATSNADELRTLFSIIAKQILLRLRS